MDDRQWREEILNLAYSFLGTPYKYAAAPEDIPHYFDCSSFTQYLYRKIGIELPRSTILQATAGKTVDFLKDLEVGDLLFFRGTKGHYNDELFPGKEICIGHVAIWSGDGKVIHASSSRGVAEMKIEEVISSCGPVVLIKRIS